jgi:CO/xanthine dehydrogenase Mo-binding subunit
VWSVVDCGTVVNPDTVRAQIEGGIVFGLTATLYGRIQVERGAVQESNFHDYRLLRHDEMPTLEVEIVESDAEPGGVGELGVPCVAPAVCNAWFRLTGERRRELPFSVS